LFLFFWLSFHLKKHFLPSKFLFLGRKKTIQTIKEIKSIFFTSLLSVFSFPICSLFWALWHWISMLQYVVQKNVLLMVNEL
jgi:hypothetical protein